VQVAAEVLRAVHWFNPLVWLACRQLRVGSEQACDDAVLRRGVDAADYASHLLAVARHVVSAGGGWASAPAIAHVSTLERRIAAMLNASCNREPVTRTSRALAVLATVAMTVPVAATTLTERIVESPFVAGAVQDIPLATARPSLAAAVTEAPVTRRPMPRIAAAAPVSFQETVRMQAVVREDGSVTNARVVNPAAAPQQPASLSGTIRDPQGGVLPGVEVVVTNNASEASVRTITDASGAFRFRDLAPGEYQFLARLPGFRTATDSLNLSGGQELRHDRVLPIGQLTEEVTVTCGPAATAGLRFTVVTAFSVAKRSTAARLFLPLREAGPEPAFAAQAVPVRVGGNLKAPQQIKKAAPKCPAVTPGAGLIVILEATIGADGVVKDVVALRPRPADDKQVGYVQEAMNAVRQWEYTPTLLNNVPMPVIMTVTVTFTVQAGAN
jgi:hypothetical protein